MYRFNLSITSYLIKCLVSLIHWFSFKPFTYIVSAFRCSANVVYLWHIRFTIAAYRELVYIPVANYKYIWASRVILGVNMLTLQTRNAHTRTNAYATAQTHTTLSRRGRIYGPSVICTERLSSRSICYTTLGKLEQRNHSRLT